MSNEEKASIKNNYKGTVVPCTADGRLYHLGLRKGELANRIITVGDIGRAIRIAKEYFDKDKKTFYFKSSRGFVTITGFYKGTPVSIMGTGMGYPNMDFAIRESREIVEGEMAIIRIGTCGTPVLPVGSIAVSNSSVLKLRNPDAWIEKSKEESDYYIITKKVFPDEKLTKKLFDLIDSYAEKDVYMGLNATGDSFYSSQGRVTKYFDDKNENLIERLEKKHPNCISIEMESFHLLDLASCTTEGNGIKTANALIVLAQRKSDKFLPSDEKATKESILGLSALESLKDVELKNQPEFNKTYVWDDKSDFSLNEVNTDLSVVGSPIHIKLE